MIGHAAEEVGPKRLFHNHNYLRLFAAQVTSLLGSGVTSVALAVLAYEMVGGGATVIVGIALTLRILAFVLVSPVAGVLADRVDRKVMLVAADVARFILLGFFPFISEVWHIYVLIFAINAATAVFTPTFEAALPDVVGPKLYTKAISFSRVALDVEAAIGPVVAGVLIAWIGVRWTFWFDAATYLASALLVLSAKLAGPATQKESVGWRNLFAEVSYGTRILLREAALRRALVLHFVEAVAGAVVIVATVVYVRDVLELGNAVFGLTMGAVGAGSTVAALWLAGRSVAPATRGQAGHSEYHAWAGKTLLIGGLLSAVALLPGFAVPQLPLLLIMWTVVGAGGAMIAIPSLGLLASHTLSHERGRAYSAHFALTHLFWLGTYPAAGWLARGIGTPWTFTLAGILCVALTAIAGAMNSGGRAGSD